MNIRRATFEDIDMLTRLYNEFHKFHVKGVPDRLRTPASYDYEDLLKKLADILERDDAVILVAESAKGIAGLAEAYIKQDEASVYRVAYRYVHLQSMVVSEGYRRKKIGQTILRTVEQWARENSASEIRLDIWEFGDGPLEFYEKQGYHTLRRTMVRRL